MINGKLQESLQALYSGELLSVEVPEWAELLEDGKIYYTPLTIKEQQRLQPWAQKNDAQMYVELLMMKACNGAGEHLFDTGARSMLMEQVPGYIIQRIGEQMLLVPEVSDFKKK